MAPNMSRKPTAKSAPAAIHWVHRTRAKPSWLNHRTSVHVRAKKPMSRPAAARMKTVQARGPGRAGPGLPGRAVRPFPPEEPEPDDRATRALRAR